MTYTEHKITLDIHKTVSSVSLSVKKGDTARRLLIHLAEKGRPYHIDDGCYAVFTALKPDGKVVFNNCTIDKCVIIYDFTEQTVAAAGTAECEIVLYGADGKQLTSASFNIIVEDTVYDAETEVESTSEYNALANLISQVQNITARSSMAVPIIAQVGGERIDISDASNNPLQGLRIFGKSIQDGTPTMEAPVEIVSLEAPVVTVSDGAEVQTMAITTPGGLCGIPVASGGNYTDAEGQQWICDEVDLGLGVYVRRIYTEIVTPEKIIRVDNNYTSIGGAVAYFTLAHKHFNNENIRLVMCDRIVGIAYYARGNPIDIYRCYAPGGDISVLAFRYPVSEGEKTIEEARTDFVGAVVSYVLATPIETRLTDAEISSFAALHTYKPNTTIYNDAGAYMAAEYVADTKTYIDVASGSAAIIGEVTILANKWVGTDSPYSQVVEIEGVTECSQVDLKPSVDQLAIFHEKDLAFVTENEDGVVTIYAIGDKPTNDYTMQVSITEVKV